MTDIRVFSMCVLLFLGTITSGFAFLVVFGIKSIIHNYTPQECNDNDCRDEESIFFAKNLTFMMIGSLGVILMLHVIYKDWKVVKDCYIRGVLYGKEE